MLRSSPGEYKMRAQGLRCLRKSNWPWVLSLLRPKAKEKKPNLPPLSQPAASVRSRPSSQSRKRLPEKTGLGPLREKLHSSQKYLRAACEEPRGSLPSSLHTLPVEGPFLALDGDGTSREAMDSRLVPPAPSLLPPPKPAAFFFRSRPGG